MQNTKVDSMSISDLRKLKVALKSTKIRFRKDLIGLYLGYLNSPEAPEDAYSFAMKETISFASMRWERINAPKETCRCGLSDRDYDAYIMRKKAVQEAIKVALS